MGSDASSDLDPAFFAEMVETVGVGVGIYGRDGRYIYVNDAYAALFDARTADLVGTPLWEVVDRVDADRFDGYWESFDTEETRKAETVHEYNGVTVPVATVTTKREIDDTPYHFGTIKDISERTAREREIERQNERLDAFASVVSHDLRNPLNVAQGYLDLLAEDVDREEVTRIENALDRMESLITELLSLARSGEEIDDTEPTRLADTAMTAWDVIPASNATLAVTEEDLVVAADGSRLQQLFENLFRNAVEHGSTSPPSQAREDAVEHGGADVAVTVGPVEGGFYVADDGPGIPPERREEVFAAGYTTAEDGTGFGLSIVDRIVDGHGWDLRVTESEAGGARFEVTGVSVVE